MLHIYNSVAGYIHRVPKKEDTKLMAVTLSFINRFSKFLTVILSGKFAAQ